MALNALVNRRTLLIAKVDALKVIVDGHATTPLDQLDVQNHLEQVRKLTSINDTLCDDIIDKCKSAADIATNHAIYDVEDKKLAAIKKALQVIFATFPTPTTATTSKAATSFGTGSADIRLPKLEIPKFDGDLMKWMSFYDLFVASVHTNSKLSDSQKLQYLKGLVSGEPSTLIDGLLITDANYAEAVKILKERYDDKREIIKATFDRLISQPVIQQENPATLQKLADTTSECIRSFEVQKIPMEQVCELLIIYIIQKKLDTESKLQWERKITPGALPSFKEFVTFLNQQAKVTAAAGGFKSKSSKPADQKQTEQKAWTKKTTSVHYGETNNSKSCVVCSKDHSIYKCDVFIALSVPERYNAVKKHNLCFNCLQRNHRTADCKSEKHCQKCDARHHTFIHRQKEKEEPQPQQPQSNSGEQTKTTLVGSLTNKTTTDVLLGTALIKIKDSHGQYQICRALLDSGSDASIISENCAQKLGLKKHHINLPITGAGEVSVGTAKSIVNFRLFAVNKQFHLDVDALVMSKVTGKRSQNQLDVSTWTHIKSLTLADPKYYNPSSVDILLGNDVFPDLLLGQKITGHEGAPTAIATELGWVLMGKYQHKQNKSVSVYHTMMSPQDNISSVLNRFWELEEVPKQIPLTKEEEACEKHFADTHFRIPTGRYGVKLPFKENAQQLGESRQRAVQRLKQLERRFSANPDLKKEYSKVINEYLALGHMEEVPENEIKLNQSDESSAIDNYYMPHHVVIKQSSSTTKYRVVCDASAATTTGVSLNDVLMVGPRTQPDLVTILIRFRIHKIAITADIVKMYRQFLVHRDHINFLRMVWRDDPDQPIRDYRMLTCTFGTASAPYQAVKCLQQLAKDEEQDFPKATPVMLRDIYVDDLMSGANNEDEAIELKDQLIQLSARGQLQFSKWSSNSTKFLESLPSELRETNVPLNIDLDETVKTLGLRWSPATDTFSFQVTLPQCTGKITKRIIASENAKIFDPLGFLSPVTIRGKLLLQELWKDSVDWDDQLPEKLQVLWKIYISTLPAIREVKIKRFLFQSDVTDNTQLSLHGFCDASEKAYAAAVYIRSVNNDNISVRLVAAKTKVAPIKQQSLPRLELCGAVLLARLMDWVQDSLDLNIQDVHGWTDSTTVLAWLASPPQRWKTFVANRVSEIQNVISYENWHHVRGEDNPADCASRGIPASELSQHPLWWTGPSWLNTNQFQINPSLQCETVEEEKAKKVVVGVVASTIPLISKISSLPKLLRVTSYCARFVNQFCAKWKNLQPERFPDFVTVTEMENALLYWIKTNQSEHFAKELRALQNGKDLPTASRILALSPFIDEKGIIRVGGRLKNSGLHSDKKHPMLLPKKCELTALIVSYYHTIYLHAGPQLLLAILQERFWILGGRDVVRLHSRNCIICVRHRAQTAQQLMGDLPAARVQPSRPFSKSGLDYAGPFTLVAIKGRGQKTFKGYICLFVCFATRAIHLELATELTTDAFIAALQRFIARRGKCTDIYSDCGTNFVGANHELKRLLKSAIDQQQCNNFATDQGIRFHFNPPAAPHFGGLHEAGVKSAKYHLKRVMGTSIFSLEEMTTVLAQIEACLNSRPITPMSSDPADLSALTPGHFLVGDALTAIPQPDYTDLKENRLSRWERTQKVFQHFWRRWSQEYVTQLQQRQKWNTIKDNVNVGDLVLLKDDNKPPMDWKLGRIVSVSPGKDDIVRVVIVKTATGNVKRPIAKICILPLKQEV